MIEEKTMTNLAAEREPLVRQFGLITCGREPKVREVFAFVLILFQTKCGISTKILRKLQFPKNSIIKTT